MIIYEIRLFLESINPLAPWIVLASLVWFAIYLLRKYTPEIWLMLERMGPQNKPASQIIQAIPSLIMGAAAASMASNGDVKTAVMGAVVASIAPVWHHTLKASVLPYKGEVSDVKNE